MIPFHHTRFCGKEGFWSPSSSFSDLRNNHIHYLTIREFFHKHKITHNQDVEASMRVELIPNVLQTYQPPRLNWPFFWSRDKNRTCKWDVTKVLLCLLSHSGICWVDRTRTCMISSSQMKRLSISPLPNKKSPRFVVLEDCTNVFTNELIYFVIIHTIQPSPCVGHWGQKVCHVCWRFKFIMQIY